MSTEASLREAMERQSPAGSESASVTMIDASVAGDIAMLDEQIAPAPIDSVLILANLRSNPNASKIKDSETRHRLIDQGAIYLQARLAERDGQDDPAPPDRQLEEVFSWLSRATKPAREKICRSYDENSRAGHSDFSQIIQAHMVKEIIPDYDPSQGHFMSFFKSVAWKRVQEYVNSSASQLSTSTHFSDLTPEERQTAYMATSYHQLAAEGARGRTPEEYVTHHRDETLRDLLTFKVLGEIAASMPGLSDMEETALKLKAAGFSYEEIGDIVGKPAKSIDNAVQRARQRKLSHIDVEELGVFE